MSGRHLGYSFLEAIRVLSMDWVFRWRRFGKSILDDAENYCTNGAILRVRIWPLHVVCAYGQVPPPPGRHIFNGVTLLRTPGYLSFLSPG